MDDAGLDTYCLEQEIFSEDSNLKYNHGTEVCKMISGDVTKIWKDLEGTTVKTGETVEKNNETVDRKLCCLAFTEEQGHVNFDWELSFACHELEFDESEYTYDEESMICTVDNISFVFVDYDVDEIYTEEIDGEKFSFSETTTTDDRDPCCQNADGDEMLL